MPMCAVIWGHREQRIACLLSQLRGNWGPVALRHALRAKFCCAIALGMRRCPRLF